MKKPLRMTLIAVVAALLVLLVYNQVALRVTDPAQARWRALEAAGLGTPMDLELRAGGYSMLLGRYTTTGRYVGTGERAGRHVFVKLTKPSPVHSWRVAELAVEPAE